MYEIDNKKFGAFLVRLRKEAGMTQKELAEKLYVSDKAVSKWERGLSLPDIALLRPMGELLGVSVTELLSGQYIREDQPLTVREVEPLLAGALGMTVQEQEAQRAHRRTWGKRFALALLAFCAEILLLGKAIPLWDEFAACLILAPVMAGIFGAYLIFAVQEKLPAFYDQYRVSFYSDDFFHMSVPGVSFNNRNWLHILNALRTWSCLTLGCWAVVYAGVRWILAARQFPELWLLGILLPLSLFAILGGIFIPVYVVGKRYE